MTTPEDRCNAVGDLTVDGRRVAWLRCTERAGHERRRRDYWTGAPIESTPHRAVLEWADDPVDVDAWPEALDADETFDVEVEVDERVAAEVETAAQAHERLAPWRHDVEPSTRERADEFVKQEARSTRPGSRCPERLPDGARCIATAGHDFGHLSAAGDRWGEPYAETGATGGRSSIVADFEPPYSLFGR